MGVEALGPEATVEGPGERIVGPLARLREVQHDAALVGPQVKIARHEPATLIDADPGGEAQFLASPVQNLQDVGVGEGEPRLPRREDRFYSEGIYDMPGQSVR
nr:hypothetical protein [Bradyrhizobium oropedii]